MEKESNISILKIQDIVSNYYGMSIKEMNRNTRKREIVEVRQISMYFCCKYSGKSLSLIGEMHARRNHSTVSHAKKTVLNLISTDEKVTDACSGISSEILKSISSSSVTVHGFSPFSLMSNINGIVLFNNSINRL